MVSGLGSAAGSALVIFMYVEAFLICTYGGVASHGVGELGCSSRSRHVGEELIFETTSRTCKSVAKTDFKPLLTFINLLVFFHPLLVKVLADDRLEKSF